jgi:hypothetical protein
VIRVRFVIVKNHGAAVAQSLVTSGAFAVAATQNVGEKRRGMAVLGEPGVRIVRGLEGVETRSAQHPPNVPRNWRAVIPVAALRHRRRL